MLGLEVLSVKVPLEKKRPQFDGGARFAITDSQGNSVISYISMHVFSVQVSTYWVLCSSGVAGFVQRSRPQARWKIWCAHQQLEVRLKMKEKCKTGRWKIGYGLWVSDETLQLLHC